MDQAVGRRAGGSGRRAWATPSPCSGRRRGQIGRRGRRRGTRSAARPRLRRRAQPDLGEPDRQRARRDSRIRPRRGAGEPRAAARGGARRRQRTRHPRRRSASASSIRSSPPSRWGRAPAWASTSSGVSSATTTAKSPSSRSRAGRSSASRCRLAETDAPERRREQARPPRRRRRSASARRRAPRPPLAVPGALHGDERRRREQEALATARELKSRGDSLAMVISDQRMPGMLGNEVLAQIARGLPAGAARPAHGLLGHRSGRQGHQRGAPRPLPVEAVGSARGTSVPGGRRSARRVAGRVSARGEGAAAGRTPVVAAIARDQGLPGEQSHSLSLARRRAGSGRARAARRGRRRAPTSFRRCSSKTESVLRNPEPRQVAERLGRSLVGRASTCTTS